MAFYFALMNVSSVKLEEELRQKKLRKKYGKQGDLSNEQQRIRSSSCDRQYLVKLPRNPRSLNGTSCESYKHDKTLSRRRIIDVRGRGVSRPTAMSPVQEVSVSESTPPIGKHPNNNETVPNRRRTSRQSRIKRRMMSFEQAAYQIQDDQPCSSSQCLINDQRSVPVIDSLPKTKKEKPKWKQVSFELGEGTDTVLERRTSELTLNDSSTGIYKNGFLEESRPRSLKLNQMGAAQKGDWGGSIEKLRGLIRRAWSLREQRPQRHTHVMTGNSERENEVQAPLVTAECLENSPEDTELFKRQTKRIAKRTQSLSFRFKNKPNVIRVRYSNKGKDCEVTVSQDDLLSSIQNLQNERLEQDFCSALSVTSLPACGIDRFNSSRWTELRSWNSSCQGSINSSMCSDEYSSSTGTELFGFNKPSNTHVQRSQSQSTHGRTHLRNRAANQRNNRPQSLKIEGLTNHAKIRRPISFSLTDMLTTAKCNLAKAFLH